ncbi:hypothetical protein [Clostridium polynesiense]|uniref:hypothetical protein n=1 Tax=Clostridium polynesiense TaxID=1325933 RepID=UPI00058B293E|nr:hypothetical protein [Clostridium polynesiense]
MNEIYYIQRSIKQCTSQLDENNIRIRKLRDRIIELEYIKHKLRGTQEKLYDYRSIKRRHFVRMKESLSNVKFASECSDEMLRFIDGNRASSAHDNIDSAIAETKNEIRRKEAEIRDLESKNYYLKNRIINLNEKMLELENKRGD